MRVLDLFSGIGGFSLGLERAGMQTIQFVEIEPFCQRVLRKHWPKVPIHDDIRTFHAPAGFADVICGGFPCQDISNAGAKAGIEGERSGLWSEYARLIGEVRPQYAIMENVAALCYRGLGRVLGDLAALGYDADWHCIPASAIGADHERDRVWIVAYSDSAQCEGRRLSSRIHAEYAYAREHCRWEDQPGMARTANGLPGQMDRLKAIGNAVVPQIPEILGRAIMSLDRP